ncbi:MAG: anaerobic sulfatase maturase [candidate division Zixibacteria bacterium]|nr:anaerobic sulfatase maturase [candidate division Zixibacteria bacterium]
MPSHTSSTLPTAGTASVPVPAFHVMMKPRGAICNLDCRYCYFLSKERLYPESRFRMTDEVLDAYTRQYIEAQQVPEVTFAWQGGEPTLMGLDFFRRAVERQQGYKKPDMKVFNTLQTNGTLLDEAWCDFFREHGFLIGLSLDGPRDLHDRYRVDKAGKPTFDVVMRAARLMQERGVEFNILATVHAANAGHPLRVYRFLRDEVKTRFIQFIPIVERDNDTGYQEGERVTTRSVTGREYGRFLIGIFDEWVRRDVGQVYVQIFDVSLAAWAGERPGLCIFMETCGDALAMEHNGDLYSCDHFVEPAHLLGNLLEISMMDMVTSEQQRLFGANKRDTLPRYCRECDVRFVCNGGCPKDRILDTPDGEAGLNYLCEGFKTFFRHIDGPMRFMANELRHRRPPANIMTHIRRQETETALQIALSRAGRNDPCPCGSGKKYKLCHGQER